MSSQDKYYGVWPVMLTPFNARREIDWASLEKLIDWYLSKGVHGLFANCQSSEMFFLSSAESLQLTKFVVDYVDGRVPVVASGHTAEAISQQKEQVGRIAETGVDSVILISNRLASADEDDEVVLANLQRVTEAVPASVGLGIYECPHPYKRLLSARVVSWCAENGRFNFIKDTCCRLETIKRRLQLVEGSPLHIANANTATLLDSLKAGAHGYSGVMANFHPELYVWLIENWQQEPQKAQIVSDYLTTASLIENVEYPICAKDYQLALGNFETAMSRVRSATGYYAGPAQTTMQQMCRLGESVKAMLALN